MVGPQGISTPRPVPDQHPDQMPGLPCRSSISGMPGHDVVSAVMRFCLNKDRDGGDSIGIRLSCPPALRPWTLSMSRHGHDTSTGDFRRPGGRCSLGETTAVHSTTYHLWSRPTKPGIAAMASSRSRTYDGTDPITWKRHRGYTDGINRIGPSPHYLPGTTRLLLLS